MTRSIALLGTVAAVTLAFVLPPVLDGAAGASGHDHAGPWMTRRGRVERRGLGGPGFDPADPMALGGAGTAAADPAAAGSSTPGSGGSNAAPPPVAADQAKPPKPDVQKFEPITVDDIEMCVVDRAEEPAFTGRYARIHLNEEGELFWVSSKGPNPVDSPRILKLKLDKAFVDNLIVVPHKWTQWQYVKTAFDTAYSGAVQNVMLGVATADAPKTLKVIPIKVASRNAPLPETAFRIKGKKGKPGIALEVDGTAIETFPTELAIAWGNWRKEHPDADTSTTGTTPVVLDCHPFTEMEQVAPVFEVLRGLGIEAERHVSEKGGFGNRRRR